MSDFKILDKITYLDNAATTQKPECVINAISGFYESHNANIHRGLHTLSEEASEMYEEARKVLADFINAKTTEVVFTSGTTHSINMVAGSWGLTNLDKDSVILTTISEHHSNFIPWQQIAKKTGAKLEVVDITETGELDLEDFKNKLTDNVKIVAISHASNVLGTIFPIKKVCSLAHEKGALVCVDGAQAVPHMPVNMKSLDCDFYAFSAHKMCGPTGVGVLWAKEEILEKMEPFLTGGGMIDEVTVENSSWAKIPEKFEAGTPNIAGVIGFAEAIRYLDKIGMKKIQEQEKEISDYCYKKLDELEGVTILGPKESEKRTCLFSFTVEGIHSHDVAAVLNSEGVAVRSGNHCAMPLHKKLGISGSTRASFYIYNKKEDVDKLVKGIKKAQEILL